MTKSELSRRADLFDRDNPVDGLFAQAVREAGLLLAAVAVALIFVTLTGGAGAPQEQRKDAAALTSPSEGDRIGPKE